MERVLPELTHECEITARMYAKGYEKKEIADLKCRAFSTVSNQIQTAMEILQVRNGRELANVIYERITGIKITIDLPQPVRAGVACCLLFVLCLNGHLEMRMQRKVRSKVNIELSYKAKTRTRGRDIPLVA